MFIFNFKMITFFFFTIMISSMMLLNLLMNPLLMGFLIILQAMSMVVEINLNFSISWLGYILFIVYLGGVLMLFSYVISLIPQFTMNMMLKKENLFMFLFFFLISNLLLKENNFMFFQYLYLNLCNFSESLFYCYSSIYKISSFFLIYLLYIMIVVVFIIENSKGSLRSV